MKYTVPINLRPVISTLVGLLTVKAKRSSFRHSPLFPNGCVYEAPQEHNLRICRNESLY